jgi:hypothetical protein
MNEKYATIKYKKIIKITFKNKHLGFKFYKISFAKAKIKHKFKELNLTY